ncbi:MAG: cytochrome-c peroxidase [Planctomycetota bacterium]
MNPLASSVPFRLVVLGLGLSAAPLLAQMPPVPAPVENPTTAEKVLLGKALFWDEQLSSDDSVACGTCHMPEAGGADPRTVSAIHPGADGLFGSEDDVFGSPGVAHQDSNRDFAAAGAFGFDVQVTGRVAPSNLGVAFQSELFWDGRAGNSFLDPETGGVVVAVGGALESQAVGPILSSVEMAHAGRTWADVRQKLVAAEPLRLATDLPADLAAALTPGTGYPALFAAAFGDPNITAARIGMALAAYQRTLVPDQTPFDSFRKGDTSALTPQQARGLQLFETSANCAVCHPAPFFSDDDFHNLGLRPNAEDTGRAGHSGVLAELGAFKTPTLRNAGLRPRLFHNGQSPGLGSPDQISDVRSVANVYLRGGGADLSNIDPFLVPLTTQGLNLQDLAHVLDFVQHGLTDPRAANGLPPFDHPTLRSHVMAPSATFGPALAGIREPGFVATAPTFLGNDDWSLGLHGGDGDTLAAVFYSLTARTPAAVFLGIPVNIGPESDAVGFVLRGSPGTAGVATWHLPIPKDPVLQDLSLYLQLFTLDAGAPIGIAASTGLEVIAR